MELWCGIRIESFNSKMSVENETPQQTHQHIKLLKTNSNTPLNHLRRVAETEICAYEIGAGKQMCFIMTRRKNITNTTRLVLQLENY